MEAVSYCHRPYVDMARTHHLLQTPSRYDVPCVNQSVQMPGGLFNLFPHIIVAFKVKYIGDEVQGVLVVLYFRVKASKVEPIG
jgi:hypothetical protein